MAYTYNEDGTSSSTFNKNRGHKPGVNQAVGGIINDVWGVAKSTPVLGAAAVYAIINSANEE